MIRLTLIITRTKIQAWTKVEFETQMETNTY